MVQVHDVLARHATEHGLIDLLLDRTEIGRKPVRLGIRYDVDPGPLGLNVQDRCLGNLFIALSGRNDKHTTS